MVRHSGYEPRFGNLIPEFERCVAAAGPQWWVMENVPDAPIPEVDGYGRDIFCLNNRQCLEADGTPAKQNRVRRWTFGRSDGMGTLQVETVVFENAEFENAAVGGAQTPGHRDRMKATGVLFRNGPSTKYFVELVRKQGLPDDFDLPGFTVAAKCQAVANGVPLAMGRAIAKAVRREVLAALRSG
jgi:DNA (cytosine-5)-methyltransferase 1